MVYCPFQQHHLNLQQKTHKSKEWKNEFRGRDPVRTKIVIDNKIIDQVNSFNYLGNMISYEKELNIDNKLHNYLKITGILNNFLGHKNLLRKQE